jgi:HK97 family phage major capsid protein
VERAYSVLTIKAIDPHTRKIRGVASTPETDRAGDIVEPMGATFASELPLLLHHNRQTPVGIARFFPPTAAGITFEAELPEIDTPGAVKDEVDRAWTSILHKLIRGVSIGFKPIEMEPLKTGGLRFVKSEILELSLVTVPAHQSATVAVVRSLDQAASGLTQPGVTGPLKTRPTMKATTGEHIQNMENKRAALIARTAEILDGAAADGATLSGDSATEHDGLVDQVKDLDADLVRWREREAREITSAVPVPASTVKVYNRVSVRPNVPIGTEFTRYVRAMAACRGNKNEAYEFAKQWDDSTPAVALALKAAIAPGTTTDATWALPLVNQTIVNDFLELLRPATVVGKIPNLRNVPFNVKIPSQTAGGVYNWVGEAKPKPLTKLAFAAETLGMNKVAGIIVLTDELVRSSNPSAEALVRADMVAGIAQFIDAQFLDPAVAPVAGVSPGSVTNGAATAVASGAPLADILGLINHFAVNNISVGGLAIVLSPANALALSFRTNSDGSPEFPGLSMDGGSYKGITFITSNTAGATVVAMQPQLILFADDGGVTIDASREASLQMDSAPMSPADATTVYVSMFQSNTVALRAERFITWKRIGVNAVKYLTAANWPAPSGTTVTVGSASSKKGD